MAGLHFFSDNFFLTSCSYTSLLGSGSSNILHMALKIATFLIPSDTFMVEDAVEAIGFGTFQWKLSILTGLSWVRNAL